MIDENFENELVHGKFFRAEELQRIILNTDKDYRVKQRFVIHADNESCIFWYVFIHHGKYYRVFWERKSDNEMKIFNRKEDNTVFCAEMDEYTRSTRDFAAKYK